MKKDSGLIFNDVGDDIPQVDQIDVLRKDPFEQHEKSWNAKTKTEPTLEFNPSSKRSKSFLKKDKYALTFMMVGFVDIVMVFVDIGLIVISIVILSIFAKQGWMAGNNKLLWLPVVHFLMSIFVFLFVSIPRAACFIKFGF